MDDGECVINGEDSSVEDEICSVWFPEAPKGYISLGCVVSPGRTQPPLSSTHCILASLVSTCGLRDCISIHLKSRYVKVFISALCFVYLSWHFKYMASVYKPNAPYPSVIHSRHGTALGNNILPCHELCLILNVPCIWIIACLINIPMSKFSEAMSSVNSIPYSRS